MSKKKTTKIKQNYIKETYKTKDEWKEHRGIGGSSASAILGQSKWTTQMDIYNELVLGIKKEIPENDRMREGRVAEDYIRKLFILEHPEFEVIPQPKNTFWLFRRKDYPLITCTPDGLFKDIKNNLKFGLEIKDVELRKREYREEWESGTLPNQYYCQTLHYMVTMNDLDGVLLLARLKYYVYDEYSEDFQIDHTEDRYFWVYREDVLEDIKYLEEKEIDFITNNIVAKKKPKLVISF
jgi:predicted phage-related endonuclease